MNIHHSSDFEISLEDEDSEPHFSAEIDAAGTDGDDLPVLTEVVNDRVEPYIGESTPIILEPITPEPAAFDAVALASPEDATNLMAERLIALETAISRHIEDWMSNELPQLLSRELDEFADRIRVKAVAHLRSTLLPLISTEIADNLDDDRNT
ncbi:MAG: hypothetical protein J0L85_01015 [Zoogloea sp.]|nr:hypothetical protein [Zoogloea sp.]MCA0188486.1 hypothetical protein [Pseudomonadota bacterium]